MLGILIDRKALKKGRCFLSQVAAYKQFGDWIRRCYGTAVASVPGGAITITTHQTALLQIPNGTQVDRVMMREDQVGIETPSSLLVSFLSEDLPRQARDN